MCSRFYIASEANLEKSFAHVQLNFFQDLPIKFFGEILPADIVPVFIMESGQRIAQPMIWGFPNWAKMGVIFNAHCEKDLDKEMFRESLSTRRMAVLITGFFERTPSLPGKKKDRYLFTLPGQKFLFLVGIWDSFPHPLNGHIPEHFIILTTAANDSMAPFHKRMPVVLTNDEVDDWLACDDFHKYLNWEQPVVKPYRSLN